MPSAISPVCRMDAGRISRSAVSRSFGQWIAKMPSAISPVCRMDAGRIAPMKIGISLRSAGTESWKPRLISKISPW